MRTYQKHPGRFQVISKTPWSFSSNQRGNHDIMNEMVKVMTVLLTTMTFRSLKKKVGEYQKLTGELPGIWRLAASSAINHPFCWKP